MEKKEATGDIFVECKRGENCYYTDGTAYFKSHCDCGYNAEGKAYCPLPNKYNEEDWFERVKTQAEQTNNKCHSLNRFNCYLTHTLENYKKASKLGNVEALINLGICFEYGHGVERNLIKAMDCYKEAGEHNNPIALCNQAILLIKMDISQGTHVNFSESFKLLQLSTHLDKHNKDAYYYLGFLFEIGYDVFGDGNTIQNAMMAFFYYKKAAELGHIKAKMKVGVAIYNGIENVFVHDEIKGIELIKEASNEGDKEASEYLKMLMDNGKMIY